MWFWLFPSAANTASILLIKFSDFKTFLALNCSISRREKVGECRVNTFDHFRIAGSLPKRYKFGLR